MEGEVKFCKWCGREFEAGRKWRYCCENCQEEAANYQRWRGSKQATKEGVKDPGMDNFRKEKNREMVYYRVAVRLANFPAGVPIQAALGIPTWNDLIEITYKDAMEDLTKGEEGAPRENGARLIQLLGAMQKVLSLPTTAVKEEWPDWLRKFLQAYGQHTAMYWREHPERVIPIRKQFEEQFEK